MRRSFAIGLGVVAVALAAPWSARADVKIEKTIPVIERKTFDPANPPAEMPERKEGEAALTVTDFTCPTNISVEATSRILPGDKVFVSYRIKRVTATMGLKVTIWLPADATEKLKAHEEGHRLIAERAYQAAEATLRQAAAKIDGRRLTGQARSLEEAERLATEQLKAANQQVADVFKDVSAATERVQNIYDELTAHGAKPAPDEPTAIKLAFERAAAEEKAAAAQKAADARKPVTRPATRPGK